MARNLAHVRSPIADPKTGMPTKSFYDILNGLAIDSDSNETILETIFQTSDFGADTITESSSPALLAQKIEYYASRDDLRGDVDALRSAIEGVKVQLALQDQVDVNALEKQIAELEVKLWLLPDVSGEVATLKATQDSEFYRRYALLVC